jgi:flagellar protein FlaJ
MKECETFIIHRFSEMYVDARIKGGVSEKLGKIIAKNVERIRALRAFRGQTTTTLIGVLYGITASLSFALYIGLQVVEMMARSMNVIELQGVPSAALVNLQLYNVGEVDFMISTLLLTHALLSSIMIKIVDGGHQINAYFHFVIMMWISALGAFVVQAGMGTMVRI